MRILRGAVALAAALALAGCAPRASAPPLPPSAPRTTTLTLIHLNDVYQISPVDGGKRGGLARVATLVKGIEKDAPDALFLLAGDFLGPSILSTRHKGAQMVEVLGATGLDVTTVGNHEFDFGLDVLRQRVGESKFEWTLANVVDDSGQPAGGAKPYVILERGGVRVGVFGLLLAETAALARAPHLRFLNPIATGQVMARRLRREGADVVVALTHQTLVADRRLAAEADVDVVIGGHDHEPANAVAGGHPVIKLEADARELGRVDVRLERVPGRRWRVASIDWSAIPVDAKVPDEPQVAALVKRYEDELGAALGEVIGRTEVVLDARAATNRTEETNLGNFLADSFRAAMGTDVALVNSGGIRSDVQYPVGPIAQRDVLAILPFNNTLVKVGVTGEHLRRILEHAVGLVEFGEGRFPQVSGVAFSYDPSKPAGSRVLDVQVGGGPLDPARRYTVSINAYLEGGGDGFDLRGADLLVDDGPMESVVVTEAIRRQQTIAPKVEQRIRKVEGPRG